MIEYNILKLFLSSKDTYSNYNTYVDYNYIQTNYNLLYRLYYSTKHIYEHTDLTSITPDALETKYLELYPTLNVKDRTDIVDLIRRVYETEVDSGLIKDYLNSLKNRKILLSLSNEAYQAYEGKSSLAKVNELVTKLNEETIQNLDEEFVTDDLDYILQEVVTKPGLRWRLQTLNRSLGSLRKGDFGFVFARPETGKTTFLASEITHMATQTEMPLLWFNNEEDGKKVKLRCVQAALGATMGQILQDRNAAREKYSGQNLKRVRIIDEPSIDRTRVEQIVDKYKPALIVFDQIDKLKGFKEDRRDLEMGSIYRWARELAKTYCPVIGVCQADGTGEGVKWLTMNHVADAKTAKQAEADWILGIGKSSDDALSGVRYFNISKNKLVGDADTLPEMRHGKAEVIIEPEIARYREIR